MPACRPGIEPHALAQFGNRLLSRAAVPQGRAEVVPYLGRFGTKARGPLQVWKRGRQVALLAEDVSLQRVRLRMIGVPLEGVGERVSRRLEIAPCGRRLRAPDGLVCRARWRRSGLPRGGALLLQSGAERVVTLAQLGIDLERAFELRDRSAELAGSAAVSVRARSAWTHCRDRPRRRDAGDAERRRGHPFRAVPCPG